MSNINVKMKAISSLAPGASFIIDKETILISSWHSVDATQPTEAEIATEVTRLQAEYDAQAYARDRADAYPSLTDQADMAYWDRQNGTTTLDDAITAVKEAHPKPA
jgi:hypothetical protein